jgi:hypothetical protein
MLEPKFTVGRKITRKIKIRQTEKFVPFLTK